MGVEGCTLCNSQKFVWPTVHLIIENSKAAPSPKKSGRKRYTPKVFCPGQLSKKRCRRLVGCFIGEQLPQKGEKYGKRRKYCEVVK